MQGPGSKDNACPQGFTYLHKALRVDLLRGSHHGQRSQVAITESEKEHKQDRKDVIVEDDGRNTTAGLPQIAEQDERDEHQSQQRTTEDHILVLTILQNSDPVVI